MKKNNLIKLFLAMINILILIILMLIFGLPNNPNINLPDISTITLVAFILSIFSIISMLIAKVKWHNLSFIYLLFYIIFLFGHVFCKYLFNYVDSTVYDASKYLGDITNISRAIVLSIYCMLAMNIGILLCMFFKKENKSEQASENIHGDNLNYIKTTALVILIISAPFAIYTLAEDLSLAFSGGYRAVYTSQEIGLNSIKDKLTTFFYIGQLLLLVSYKGNLNKAKAVFWITAIYSGIKIILGGRGLPLLELLFLFIVWHVCIKKVGKKVFILLIISIIPISVIISMMKVVRSMPVSEWIDNVDIMLENSFESNPILSTINEMGGAIYPTTAALNLFPSVKDYKYGSTYWYGLKSLIPNLSTTKISDNVKGNIAHEVAMDTYAIAFGGSVVEDLYANFGCFSILAIGIIGYLLCYFSIIFYENREKHLFNYVLYSLVAIRIVWTIRNTINPIFTYIGWYCLGTYIIYKCVCRYYIKRSGR